MRIKSTVPRILAALLIFVFASGCQSAYQLKRDTELRVLLNRDYNTLDFIEQSKVASFFEGACIRGEITIEQHLNWTNKYGVELRPYNPWSTAATIGQTRRYRHSSAYHRAELDRLRRHSGKARP